VSIVGTRIARTPGSAHVINRRQLERFRYDDSQAILSQVPGVYVRQEDGVGLRPNLGVRGVNPDRSKKLTLMEDGILFGPAPYSAPAAYYFPLMARMQYIRIVKGPSAIAYGPQTVGGAVDFLTRAVPDHTTGMVDVALGEYGYRKAHAYFGAGDERSGFLIEGVHLGNTGFKELPSGADTGSTRNDWMGKFRYALDPHAENSHEFQLKLAYADEVSNETYLGLTDADFRADPYQRYPASALDQMKNHRTSIVLTHHFEAPSAHLKIRTDVYRHDYSRTWRKFNHQRGAMPSGVIEAPDDPLNAEYLAVLRGQADSAPGGIASLFIGPNQREFVSQGIQSVAGLDLDSGPITQRLEFGVRFHQDQIDRRHSENAFAMIGGELVPEEEATRVTASNRASSHAVALHLLDAISFHELTLTPGVRLELIQSSLDDRLLGTEDEAFVAAVMPGVGAYYGLTRAFGVLAGVYRGFSPPPPGSDDTVEPEYSVNYEGGMRYSDGAARAELIGFYNDYSNLTDVCTLSSGCLDESLDRQFDAGRARIYGFETFATHEVPLGRSFKLPFHLACTLTQAEFRTSFTSQDPIYGAVLRGDEVPYVPRHQIAASAGLEHPRAGGAIAFMYVSRMREVAGSGPIEDALATDEQYWLDLSGRLQIIGPLSVYGSVRNVLGGEFIVARRPYGARPNAPRWVQVGAKVEL
jgi:Fe(3+) dicitrate transport protein